MKKSAMETTTVWIDPSLPAEASTPITELLRDQPNYGVIRTGSLEKLLTEQLLEQPTLVIVGAANICALAALPESLLLSFVVVGDGNEVSSSLQGYPWRSVSATLQGEELQRSLLMNFMHAISALQQSTMSAHYQARIASLEGRLSELNEIGVALSTEKELDRLLDTILTKARQITVADSGSLYLLDKPEQENSDTARLRFQLAQNDSLDVPFKEFTLPINKQSIVGYVALMGVSHKIDDVYQLSKESEFQHNSEFDRTFGYHTKSMLVVPMKNQKDELVGVLQLINKKTGADVYLNGSEQVDTTVLPFDATDLSLVESLASQACVAIENARLYQDIQRLFEGFITASVLAIESRDPTTSGHSERVAKMTCGLAEVVDKQNSGRFSDILFSEQDMRELRYASLLHDFGKIGVPEEVLVKAQKLYPHEIEVIKSRFYMIRSLHERDVANRKLQYLLDKSRDEVAKQLDDLDAKLTGDLDELDHYLEFVLKSVQPTVLEDGAFDLLTDIAAKTYLDSSGDANPYLTEKEVQFLSIRKGSLSVDERLAIESHVTHSYNFLKQIPWTTELKGIPEIAYAHHEKLNGSGYPQKLTDKQIPFQTKIMTLTDIFDALSARDRPYKKAVPVTRALDILQMEVDDGCLDSDLLKLFIEGKVYKLVIEE